MKILCVFGENAYGMIERGVSYEKANFLPAFQQLGHDVSLFDSFSRSDYTDFADLNLQFLRRLDEVRPDLVFMVLMGYEIWTETLDIARAGSPAAFVNWGTDDSWKFNQVSRFLVPHLDFHITTDHAAADQARKAGFGNVLSSQWGASQEQILEPLDSNECAYDVSFIGNLYGDRRGWIDAVQKRGINVTTFGHNSSGGVVAAADIPQIHRKSRVSLNFSHSGLHLIGARLKRSRQIKARVFEVPAAGGLLLTQSAEGLSDYFHLGREADCFDRPDELAAKIRFYLSNPGARDQMARAGHKRAVAEHTYSHRFRGLLETIQASLGEDRKRRPWRLDRVALEKLADRHRDTTWIRPFRNGLETLARAVVGEERGARAARRIVFEASWRLAGKKTFRAAGLPGRMFFRES